MKDYKVHFLLNKILSCSFHACPCGYLNDTLKECTCTPNEIKRYTKKISGPLLDRIDIHITVPRLEYTEMVGDKRSESSSVIRSRVEEARKIQLKRLSKYHIFCNAQMRHRHIQKTCLLTTTAQSILEQVFVKMGLSARSYDRIIKVARTIADLDNSEMITERHIAEAVQLRSNINTTL